MFAFRGCFGDAKSIPNKGDWRGIRESNGYLKLPWIAVRDREESMVHHRSLGNAVSEV